ncbi:MAG: hypothetical protein V4719_29990 [Planctomycetota bacterium]
MPPAKPQSNAVANAGTFIAVMLLLVCSLGLFLLVMMVNPFIMGIILVPTVLGPLAAFQYLAWGRWLNILHEEDKAREAENK